MLKNATPEERKKIIGGLVRKVEAQNKERARVEFNILPAPPEAAHDGHGSSYLQRWLANDDTTRTLVLCEWVPRRRVQPRWWMNAELSSSCETLPIASV
jgi:hypothetical protein